MATVTGALEDFGLANLTPYSPIITFTPSRPAVNTILAGQVIHATRPIVVTTTLSGFFEVELAPNEGMIPDTYYSISIKWLDSAGGFIGVDFPDWELRVPTEGGFLSNILAIPSNPAQAWVDTTAPTNPTPGTWWLNPETADLFEWSN